MLCDSTRSWIFSSSSRGAGETSVARKCSVMLAAARHPAARPTDEEIGGEMRYEAAALATSEHILKLVGPEPLTHTRPNAGHIVNEPGAREQRVGELDLRFG